LIYLDQKIWFELRNYCSIGRLLTAEADPPMSRDLRLECKCLLCILRESADIPPVVTFRGFHVATNLRSGRQQGNPLAYYKATHDPTVIFITDKSSTSTFRFQFLLTWRHLRWKDFISDSEQRGHRPKCANSQSTYTYVVTQKRRSESSEHRREPDSWLGFVFFANSWGQRIATISEFILINLLGHVF
jgi:hypothetical protein